jgi:hypothetical protein
VHTVANVYRRLPQRHRAVILTSNYGEAGAVDRFGPPLGLPHAYSGHNAYGDWGPPPDRSRPVITVGLQPAEMAAHLRDCRVKARITNRAGIDNDELGEPVMVCEGPLQPWAREWLGLRHLG